MAKTIDVLQEIRDAILAGNSGGGEGVYQPVDDDLTAIAALATTPFGRALLTLAAAADLRAAGGLGSAATADAADFVSAVTARAANLVLAGPASGAAAAPSWRGLVAADVPAFIQPSYHGLLAWCYDPAGGVNSGAGLNDGQILLSKIWLPEQKTYTISNIWAEVTAAGSGNTAAVAGIYSSAGVRLAQTASMVTAWSSAAMKTMALTAPVDVAGGPSVWIYAALLATGGTMPQFRRGPTSSAPGNAGLTAASGLRFGLSGSGLSALPANITISSMTATTLTFWQGVS